MVMYHGQRRPGEPYSWERPSTKSSSTVSRTDAQLVASILEAKLTPAELYELQWGIETELEHVQTVRKLASQADFIIAGAIALDHLKEDPRYYTKLRRWHATR